MISFPRTSLIIAVTTLLAVIPAIGTATPVTAEASSITHTTPVKARHTWYHYAWGHYATIKFTKHTLRMHNYVVDTGDHVTTYFNRHKLGVRRLSKKTFNCYSVTRHMRPNSDTLSFKLIKSNGHAALDLKDTTGNHTLYYRTKRIAHNN